MLRSIDDQGLDCLQGPIYPNTEEKYGCVLEI